ncbi:MAG TPA: hypothetical protein VHI55_02455 [Gaiellaceae bacterium]|jgi:hypothetical protein|nr:hypothetical protein [Gaiellaceae bacterium]
MGLVIGNAVADAGPAQPMRLPARLRRFVDQSPDFLKPELTVKPRTTDREAARYVRSYLIMRVVVGALGVLLPLLLVLIGRWLDGEPWFRDSLSAYYYSGVRELFVGVLSAIGVFLFTYKVTDHSLDNTLTFVAAAAVVLVVLFPTGPSSHVAEPTPLQEELGVSRVQTIHFAAALLFIVSLAVISFFYGVREGRRPAREGKRPPLFWRWCHWVCALFILGALAGVGLDMLTEWGPSESVLIGEWVAVWAFGASWLMKGLELDYLRSGVTAPSPGLVAEADC